MRNGGLCDRMSVNSCIQAHQPPIHTPQIQRSMFSRHFNSERWVWTSYAAWGRTHPCACKFKLRLEDQL